MLSYIASNPIKDLIIQICEELHITILSTMGEVDFSKYIKQTKVNFLLIKYFVIDLESLKGTEEEKIKVISFFKEMYPNVRIILIGQGYDEQNIILTSLYEKDIYNIINVKDLNQIQLQLKKCITQGLQKKDAKKFKKIEIKKQRRFHIFLEKIKKFKNDLISIKKDTKNKHHIKETPNSVYFFGLILETVTRLLKLIAYISIFVLTSIGLTILFNPMLRNAVIQILNAK